MANKPNKCIKEIGKILSKKDIDKALATVEARKSFQYIDFLVEIGLTTKAPGQVKQVFDLLDRDCSGLVYEDDVVGFMKAFNPNARDLTPGEVAAMMKDGDLHNEGKIRLDGFLAMVEKAKNQA